MPIDSGTRIDKGMPISENFVLEHLTTGAYHHITAQWMPEFSAKIIPQQQNGIFSLNGDTGILPLWKIADNLRITAESILEPLLREMGPDMVVKAGFLNNIAFDAIPNEVKHTVGLSVDVYAKGYGDNMYNVAKEVQKICKRASGLTLVYGNSSWIHVDVNAKRLLKPRSRFELPPINSLDLDTGELLDGIVAFRGYL